MYVAHITWSLLEASSIRVFILLALHEAMAFSSLISSSAKFWSDTSARIEIWIDTFWQLEDASRSLFETSLDHKHRLWSIWIDGMHNVLILQHRKWSSCMIMHERNPTILQAFIAWHSSKNYVCVIYIPNAPSVILFIRLYILIPHFLTSLTYSR